MPASAVAHRAGDCKTLRRSMDLKGAALMLRIYGRFVV